MFEFIGVVVVAWLAYVAVKIFLRAKATVRSQDVGVEARYIATKELRVPEVYFNAFVTQRMDAVKTAALHLQEHSADHKALSWPRLIAWAIYLEFHQDCSQSLKGNPVAQARLDQMAISPDVVNATLAVHPRDMFAR